MNLKFTKEDLMLVNQQLLEEIKIRVTFYIKGSDRSFSATLIACESRISISDLERVSSFMLFAFHYFFPFSMGENF